MYILRCRLLLKTPPGQEQIPNPPYVEMKLTLIRSATTAELWYWSNHY